MVKNFEQPRTLPSRKRVSFDPNPNPKTDVDYMESLSFSDESSRTANCIATSMLNCNDIERLIQVAQALNSRKRDFAETPVELTYFQRSHSVGANQGNSHAHHCEKVTSKHHSDTADKHHSNGVPKPPSAQVVASSSDLHSECNRTEISRHPGDISQTPDVVCSNLRLENDCAKSAVQSLGVNLDKSSSTSATGGISIVKKSDCPDPCRGYSRQRRHDRKASLGTAEITKLIPTLVSDNEEFRQLEYRRKLSADSNAQNLTL